MRIIRFAMLAEVDQLTPEHLEILAWDYGLGFRGEELCKRLKRAAPGLRVESEYVLRIIKENETTFNRMVTKACNKRLDLRYQARTKVLDSVNHTLERGSEVLAEKFDSMTATLEELDPFDEEERKKMNLVVQDMRSMAKDINEWSGRYVELNALIVAKREDARRSREERAALLRHVLEAGITDRDQIHRGMDAMLNADFTPIMPDLIEDPVAEVLALVNSGILDSGLPPEKPAAAKLVEPKIEALEDAF